MTFVFRDAPDALATAASRVAIATRIPMAHVEKDFWVTEVLRGVARHSAETGISAVFKGGTSLSKAFGLLQRFSEDIDIIIMVPGESVGKDNACLKSFVVAAEAATGLTAHVDPTTATKGVKRTVSLAYPTSTPLGALRPGVRLELGARGGTMPMVQRSVTSLLVQHGSQTGLEVSFAEAVPFTMHVLAPVRTLVEKLMIVHHAAVAGDASGAGPARPSLLRHLVSAQRRRHGGRSQRDTRRRSRARSRHVHRGRRTPDDSPASRRFLHFGRLRPGGR